MDATIDAYVVVDDLAIPYPGSAHVNWMALIIIGKTATQHGSRLKQLTSKMLMVHV
jgi:hypothetical protein